MKEKEYTQSLKEIPQELRTFGLFPENLKNSLLIIYAALAVLLCFTFQIKNRFLLSDGKIRLKKYGE